MQFAKHRNVLVLLAALALLGAGGVYATSGAPPRVAASPSAVPGSPIALAAAIAELRLEIGELRDSLDRGWTCTASHERAPDGEAAASRPGDDRLVRAIESLGERLARGVDPTDLASLEPASVPDGEQRSQRLSELRRLSEHERLRENFLASQRSIVERYGIPDSVYTSPEGEVHFVYQSSETEPQIGFGFAGGVVVRAWRE